MALLVVRNLTVTVTYGGGTDPVRVVRGLSFRLDAGRALAIVGETGSGAGACVRAVAGLAPEARVSGEVSFDGTNLLGLDPGRVRRIREASIGTLSGDAPDGLHPLYRVGAQLAGLIRAGDRDVGRAEARRRAVDLLGATGIGDPARRADDYPHQLSGGTRRRVMIAMALAPGPRLLIAQEPAAGLDPTVGAAVLDLITRLRRESRTALLLATRSLAIAAETTDEIMLMYAGLPVERAAPGTIRHRPHHPYTKGLLESLPGGPAGPGRLCPIPGEPPAPSALPTGCPFHPRCRYAMPVSAAERPPPARVTGDGDQTSACWLPHEAVGLGEAAEALRVHFSRPDPG
jgi:oligopeptide/dipeptide ABC transporter ATP-binding protein